MALSPGIPTSFVPRQATSDQRRPRTAGHNLFLVIAMFIFGLSVIAAGGTFAYDRYLTHALQVNAENLASAQRDVNKDQVENFVRLRDRLTYGQDLLNNHVALSQVFNVLEAQTLASVRFSSLALAVADDHTAHIDIAGTAKNFNALAAQSNAFATEKGIRRAIFSGIVVNANKTVNFKLTADLDSKLLISQGNGTPPPATLSVPAVMPVVQTVPATSTATSTLPLPKP